MPLASGKDSGSRSAWQAIGRPMAAYCVASCVAALVLSGPWSLESYRPLSSRNLERFVNDWLIISLAIIVIAALPTFLTAVCLFMTRIPRGVGETCAGALIGPLILWILSGFRLSFADVSLVLPLAIIGTVAGFVYWLLVGRPKNPRAG